VNIQEG